MSERTCFRMLERDVITADRHMSELPPIMSCLHFKHNLTIMGPWNSKLCSQPRHPFHSTSYPGLPKPQEQGEYTHIHTHTLLAPAWSGLAWPADCTRVSVCFCSSQISHHSIDKNKQGRPGRLLKRLSVFRPLRR